MYSCSFALKAKRNLLTNFLENFSANKKGQKYFLLVFLSRKNKMKLQRNKIRQKKETFWREFFAWSFETIFGEKWNQPFSVDREKKPPPPSTKQSTLKALSVSVVATNSQQSSAEFRSFERNPLAFTVTEIQQLHSTSKVVEMKRGSNFCSKGQFFGGGTHSKSGRTAVYIECFAIQ